MSDGRTWGVIDRISCLGSIESSEIIGFPFGAGAMEHRTMMDCIALSASSVCHCFGVWEGDHAYLFLSPLGWRSGRSMRCCSSSL